MKYENGNLLLISDFEIRVLREENDDVDLFIPIDMRTLNLYIEGLPNYIKKRFQFSQVRSAIIRFSKKEGDEVCTIHLLNNIDLQSSIVNFEMDYSDYYIEFREKEYCNEMYLKKK